MGYRAEYRLAHWSGFRVVRDSAGDPIPYTHPIDAALSAANALVGELNGNIAFWRGPSRDDAREAAEKIFTRADDGKAETETQSGGD
jgi:hypothetical protein